MTKAAVFALFCAARFCHASLCCAQETPAALLPLAEASQKHAAAAQENLARWRKTRDDLAAEQKTLAAKIAALAAPGDEKLRALDEQIAAAQNQSRALDAALKTAKPAEFATLAQMLEYDRQSDRRAALDDELAQLRREQFARKRQLAKAVAGGAALCDEWAKREVQLIAASHESALAQERRDAAGRAEGNFQKQLKFRPDTPLPPEVTRLAPPPPDAALRRAAFAGRNSPTAVQKLGEGFFSQMTLSGPGLETVRALALAKNYGAALDAYKKYFFAKLTKTATLQTAEADDEAEGSANVNAAFSPPTASEIALAQQNIVAQKSTAKDETRHLAVQLGAPGNINWAFAESAPADEALLALCRAQNYPGGTGAALLHS